MKEVSSSFSILLFDSVELYCALLYGSSQRIGNNNKESKEVRKSRAERSDERMNDVDVRSVVSVVCLFFAWWYRFLLY